MTKEQELIMNYRALVVALLEHTLVHHEESALAVEDFVASDDRAAGPILKLIIEAQERDRRNG